MAWQVNFGVIPDGQYHVYYVPLFPFKLTAPALQLNLTQMRVRPVLFGQSGQGAKIDWIRVVRGGWGCVGRQSAAVRGWVPLRHGTGIVSMVR